MNTQESNLHRLAIVAFNLGLDWHAKDAEGAKRRAEYKREFDAILGEQPQPAGKSDTQHLSLDQSR